MKRYDFCGKLNPVELSATYRPTTIEFNMKCNAIVYSSSEDGKEMLRQLNEISPSGNRFRVILEEIE